MTGHNLPPSASVAQKAAGAKLFAPAAERNAQVLSALLQEYAPCAGKALELASGTGQHVTAFARAMPDLHWYPTEVDPARCASIDAYVSEAGLKNVAAAALLNATRPGWGVQQAGKNLITLANLLHLIAMPEAQTLITEAAIALDPGGVLILYGPFKRSGALTSEGDQRFDAELQAADPAIGYKDDLDILRWLSEAGLTDTKTLHMPANNLAFLARKP